MREIYADTLREMTAHKTSEGDNCHVLH